MVNHFDYSVRILITFEPAVCERLWFYGSTIPAILVRPCTFTWVLCAV